MSCLLRFPSSSLPRIHPLLRFPYSSLPRCLGDRSAREAHREHAVKQLVLSKPGECARERGASRVVVASRLLAMAVASRLPVARVILLDGSGRRGRQGFAVVGLPAVARKGRRRGGAMAASPSMEEVAQMTEPLTKEDLVAYLSFGCKPKEN